MERSLGSFLIFLVIAVSVEDVKCQQQSFCDTNNPRPNMDGVWICNPSWMIDTVPSAGKMVNTDLMFDGDASTVAVLPPISTEVNRVLVFELPEFFVLTNIKIRFNRRLMSDFMSHSSSLPFTLSYWDDSTFDTYNKSGPHQWIATEEHYHVEDGGAMLNMGGFSRLSKFWQIELPSKYPIAVKDIAFKIKASLPEYTNEEIVADGQGLSIKFRMSEAPENPNSPQNAAPTTHQCGTVQRPIPSAIVARYRLDTSFYHKYTSAYGVPILSNYVVNDKALQRACYTVRFMLADNPGIRNAMYNNKGRVSVIGRQQQVPWLPEYRHLVGWTHRAAGGTFAIPVTVGAEENILCEARDPFGRAQDILMHEFAHGIQLVAARTAIPNFTSRLQQSFLAARSRGLWRNTYANTNNIEYFAEATQAFFNQQRLGPRGGDGIQNDINTREKLARYDVNVYRLVQEIYPCQATNFIHRCDDKTQSKGLNQVFRMNCAGGGGGGGGGGNGGCTDKQANCDYWRQQNYCTSQEWGTYMTENCPKSCNKCPTTTTTTTTTTATTTTEGGGGGECKDQRDNCNYWLGEGYCTSDEWGKWMAQYCPVSCGKCVTTTTKLLTPPPLTTTTGTTTESCEDTKENCEYWRTEGHCNSDQWGAWMTENCPKSCDKCPVKPTTTTTPAPTTTTTTTTAPTTTTTPAPTTTEAPVTTKECMDMHKNCNYWLGQGLCANGEWVDWMATNCPKSCEKCSGMSTTTLLTPPPLPTTTKTTTTKKSCTDDNTDCQHWAMYCTTNDYVKENCKMTCETC